MCLNMFSPRLKLDGLSVPREPTEFRLSVIRRSPFWLSRPFLNEKPGQQRQNIWAKGIEKCNTTTETDLAAIAGTGVALHSLLLRRVDGPHDKRGPSALSTCQTEL